MLGAHGLPVRASGGSAASGNHRLGASSGFRTRRRRASAPGPAATPLPPTSGCRPGQDPGLPHHSRRFWPWGPCGFVADRQPSAVPAAEVRGAGEL